jgi:hypothetical protein
MCLVFVPLTTKRNGQAGCRVIELDVHDPGTSCLRYLCCACFCAGSGPSVYHGGTATKPVSFEVRRYCCRPSAPLFNVLFCFWFLFFVFVW